jgi:signal transduction histidine kinase
LSKLVEVTVKGDSELLAYLSHELRTGLHAIVGHAQMLRLSQLTTEDARSVERMIDAGFYLAGILDEVEEIAADEMRGTNREDHEVVEVVPLLDQLCELLGPLAGAQGVTIDVVRIEDDAAHIFACRQRLTQILLNLLSNAIKYGGGRVDVSAARAGEDVAIAVIDSGPGIDSERMRDLFEPFERLGAEQGPTPGSGIGLALSQRLAELAGARLSVSSELGQGATFSVTVKRADRQSRRDRASR